MDSKVKNLLYRNPQLYELVYPEPNDETPTMCRRMFSRFLPKTPRSILDIGCGTARDLDSLSRNGAECGAWIACQKLLNTQSRFDHICI